MIQPIRPVILIVSCKADQDRGYNDAIGETWLKQWPNQIQHVFLLGKGCSQICDDELVLSVSDERDGIAYKVQSGLHWALETGYTHMFVCFTDTYVHIPRLLDSDFTIGHYIGNFTSHPHEKWTNAFYAHGGAGYWISRDFAKILMHDRPTHNSDDVWIGSMAIQHQIPFVQDDRYTDTGTGLCTPNDNHISVHLSEFANDWNYNLNQMYDVHQRSMNTKPDPNYKSFRPNLINKKQETGSLYHLRAGTKLWSPKDIQQRNGRMEQVQGPIETVWQKSERLRREPKTPVR